MTTSSSYGVSSETHTLVSRWLTAFAKHTAAGRELNERETVLREAEKSLGEFLAPDDAKPGEIFNIWYGDSLLAVRVSLDTDLKKRYDVSIRKLGRTLLNT